MGNQLSTCFGCCPQDNNEEEEAYNETSPLLRDSINNGGASGHGGGYAHNARGHDDYAPSSFRDPAVHRGSYQQYRNGGAGSSYRNYQDQEPVNEEPSVLTNILDEGAEAIIDCTATAITKSLESQAGDHEVVGYVGNNSETAGDDEKELTSRAELYGKRLSSVAAALAQKHLAGPTRAEEGLADLGGQGERALGQAPEDILSETDQVLATEVASRVQETLVDYRVQTNSDLVVPFEENGNAASGGSGNRHHVNS